MPPKSLSSSLLEKGELIGVALIEGLVDDRVLAEAMMEDVVCQ